MKAFLTGSHVYGTPRVESDIDLVVLVDDLTLKKLAGDSDGGSQAEYHSGQEGQRTPSASLRFGRLNLICVTGANIFQAWKDGTESLFTKRPVTREEAVAEFQRRFKKAASIKDFLDTPDDVLAF